MFRHLIARLRALCSCSHGVIQDQPPALRATLLARGLAALPRVAAATQTSMSAALATDAEAKTTAKQGKAARSAQSPDPDVGF